MSRRERRLLRRQGKKQKLPEATELTKEEEKPKPQKQNKFVDWFDKNYKKNMWITIVLLAISIIIIIGNVVVTGDFINRGISLKGGVTVTVPYDKEIDVKGLESTLRSDVGGSISVRSLSSTGKTIGIIVDASDVDADKLVEAVKGELGEVEKISVETMGSSLGQSFFKQTILALLVAFVLMAIVVFFAFRTFVPSFAVILSAFSDMTMTIAALDLVGFKMETAGIAALLMLIGYSVDTDILLTTRVLRREGGTVFDRVLGAMKTGMTMTVTSFVAIFVGYFFTQSETLRQIMIILLVGLAFDVLNTWIQNVGILRWYMEKKEKKQAKETLERFHKPKEELDTDEDYEDDEEPEEKPVQHHVHHEHKEPQAEHKEHHTEHEHKTESHPGHEKK